MKNAILNESWSQFKRRMPRDAIMLLERLECGSRASAGDGANNMLLEVIGDRRRSEQISIQSKRTHSFPPVLPNFETALSDRVMSMPVVGRMMPVGMGHDQAGDHGENDDDGATLLLEG